ncbi:hypothetical protein HOC35_00635 [Candidatus Woesearchaeota archaeon]|jgi:hypothetical protein|nr:hypothetical protein [Candidatus Woesearchaeota archaeon]
MKYKKLGLLLLLFFVVSIFVVPLVSASVVSPGEFLGDIGDKILTVFKFNWIHNKGQEAIGAFMRICIWLFIFTILFAASQQIFGAIGLTYQRNIAIVLAIIIATISSIFIPIGLLLAIGEIYSTIAVVIMFGIVVFTIGLFYQRTWALPGRFWIIVRLFVLLFMWFILAIITTAVEGGL